MTTILIFFNFLICSAPVIPEVVAKENIDAYFKWVNAEKQFALFVEHLALKESGGRWQIVNSIGAIGKFQFMPGTLECLGYGHITPQRFAQDPNIFPEAVQYKVLFALLKANGIALRDYMHYCGLVIQGVEITKSGLLAACHLAGANNVKMFLNTMGKINKADCNQTSVKTYMKEFANYGI